MDKILTALDKVDKEKLFSLADGTRTRGTQIYGFGSEMQEGM